MLGAVLSQHLVALLQFFRWHPVDQALTGEHPILIRERRARRAVGCVGCRARSDRLGRLGRNCGRLLPCGLAAWRLESVLLAGRRAIAVLGRRLRDGPLGRVVVFYGRKTLRLRWRGVAGSVYRGIRLRLW